ncbi:acyl carrier protein [Paracoccus sulfuroxidans]|uniref:Acyl carrier protein n=1 Tax=Paracoccus sulfuroxidans TaxID=384678 RepID=A0A562P0U4_9RHOB|nr:acyl carrier protein [Paracoccus sulfuroxidans]TWI38098.1 acyl carrier protein [Paracoccus sulfuroxidans]
MSISQDDLANFIRTDLGIEDPIDAETELFSGGLLDSVSMVSLITFIEEKAGVTVQPSDVTLENFDTIASIEAYVRSLD